MTTRIPAILILWLNLNHCIGQSADIFISGYVKEAKIPTESGEQYFLTNQLTLEGANFTKIFGQTAFNTTLHSDARRQNCYRNSILTMTQLPVLMGINLQPASDLFEKLESSLSGFSAISKYAAGIKTNYIPARDLASITRNFISKYLRKINPKSFGGVRLKTTNLERLSKSLYSIEGIVLSADIAYKAVFREALASDLALTNIYALKTCFENRIKTGLYTDPVILPAIDEAIQYLDRAEEYWGALILEADERREDLLKFGLEPGLDFIRKNLLQKALTKYYTKTGLKKAAAHGSSAAALWTMSLWVTYEVIDALLDQHEKMQTAITSSTINALIRKEIAEGRLSDTYLNEAMLLQSQYDYYYNMHQVHSGILPDFRDFIDNLAYDEKYNQKWKTYYSLLAEETGTELIALDIFNFPDIRSNNGNLNIGFIIDSSGSMATSDPFDVRKSAMKQIVDLIRSNDNIFIVDFDDSAKWLNSSNWKNSERNRLKSDIDKINSSGGTDIGRGLIEMKNAIEYCSTDLIGAVLLLSDGKSNYNNEADWFANKGIPVYSISYKNIADANLLSRIASVTGGQYISANSEDEVVSAFMQFYNDLTGGEKFVSRRGSLLPGEENEIQFNVDIQCKQIVSNINYKSGDLDLILTSPAGRTIQKGVTEEWFQGANYTSVKLLHPEGGTWTAKIIRKDQRVAGDLTYLFEASGQSPNSIVLDRNTNSTEKLEYQLLDMSGTVDMENLKPRITLTTPKNMKADISASYRDGSFSIFPRQGPGNYKIEVELSACDRTGESIERYLSGTAYIGDISASFRSDVSAVTGGVIITSIGKDSGNFPGMRCLIYSVTGGSRHLTAEGYVTYVSEDDCQIEIQQYFSSNPVSINDIVELDFGQWQGDNSKK